jgi:predicted alpha/beta-hydrolase family hydrolase
LRRFERDLVRGWLYEPSRPAGRSLALTHGAGANCESPLLRAVAEAFAAAGFYVLRYDLPYRQGRPHGPPHPASAARDREGIRRAAEALREITPGCVVLGGHSYGGRQSSMVAAEDPEIAAALLLLSYPLHPPRKPEQLRAAHFPQWRVPAVFVHGTRDPFGSIEELSSATAVIPAPHRIVAIEKAGHELNAGAGPIAAREILALLASTAGA